MRTMINTCSIYHYCCTSFTSYSNLREKTLKSILCNVMPLLYDINAKL
jgi:hypothetical protein